VRRGMPADEAVWVITAAELVAVPTEEHHEEIPAGEVISVDRQLPDLLPKEEEIPFTVSIGPAPRRVPRDLAGGTLAEARSALEDVQLQATVIEAHSDDVPRGEVIEVRPRGGTEVPRDSQVEVVVSIGPDLVEVPRVRGMNLNRALDAIESAGLTPGDVFGPARGRPFDTDPSAGTEVRRGATVDVYLRR
jgi:eukaryotic-like serine/threonine-protein kinase